MKKILDWLKKYKLTVIVAIIVLLVGICSLLVISLFKDEITIKELNESTYALQYDSSWKVMERQENSVILEHNSGSKVTIKISELNDEYKYSDINELIDELMYSIQEQNSNYKLLSSKQDKITKDGFLGYKLLYENDDEQVMVVVYKKSDNLITISYEATADYFDILLDSVHSIIYNLDIKEERFDLENSILLDLADVSYQSNEEIDSILNESQTYEIAVNNYYVEYSIPSNFIRSELNSTAGYFNLNLDSGSITLSVNILNRNIYEYLDKEEVTNLYKNYTNYRDDVSGDYSNFLETLTKLNNEYDSYLYKNSYNYNNAIKYENLKAVRYQRQDENVELIYALNNNHTLRIIISSTGIPITEKLVSMIKINSSKNYASYVNIEKENSFLIGRLQRFADYDKESIDLVTLRIPDKYEEIDENQNIYLNRYYSLNYNEDMDIYDYDVHYELSNLSEEKVINTINNVYINSVYGEAHELVYSGDLTLNGKQFRVYDGGYTDISGIMFTDINRITYYVNKKVLVYDMPNDGVIYIEIDGNGKDINDDILNELTNFTVESKEY